jgi:Leucine-rich repeat (LRR) protein
VVGVKINKVPACLVSIIVLLYGSVVWLVSEYVSTDLSVRITFTMSPIVGGAMLYLLESRISKKSAKLEPPKELPATDNRTILEAEGFRLEEVQLDQVHNLHKLTRINIGVNELKSIDLTPLAGSHRLKELVLYFNRLEEIDLSPLAECPNLEYIDLAVNNLESIDLSPLTMCKKINAINLGGNPTGQINLEPLADLQDLKILTIDDMNLKEVDLSPLRNCTKLEFLKLNDNVIRSVDITPLFRCKSLVELEIDRIELATTLDLLIGNWPPGIQKHRKRIRVIDS